MSDTGIIAKYKQQWEEMDQKYKYMLGAIVVGGAILLVVKSKEHNQYLEEEQAQKIAQAAAKASAEGSKVPGTTTSAVFTTLPTSTRNQGMEDLLGAMDKASRDARDAKESAKMEAERARKLEDRLSQLERGGPASLPGAMNGASTTGASGAAFDKLPPPVDFAQPGTSAKAASAGDNPFSDAGAEGDNRGVPMNRTAMKVWADEVKPAARKDAESSRTVTIPINSAFESIMLTGINARSNSSGGAASGTILSANNVGAPFVSRLKGDAILPNGWKVSEYNDCFISGTGIAILSSERANVIANVMSCIDKSGNVYEAPIKAYGVDLDGIQGISGRVVTKQGSILAKTALAGVASGLGQAFTPTALPSYNQNAQSGDRQGIQYPNPNLVAGSAIGGGINEAGRALSKFYLDYAKEMFPVIEVNAGTRITWILQETVELSPVRKAK